MTGSVRSSKRRRWLTLAAAISGVAAVAFCIAGEYAVHHAEPMLRSSVIQTLALQFHSPVELDSLKVSLIRGVEVEGRGLRILYLAGPAQPDIEQLQAQQNHQPIPAMLTVDRFLFRVSMEDLKRMQARVARVEASGVELHIPPHSIGGIFAADHALSPPTNPKRQLVDLTVGRIEFRNMHLYLETATPGKDAIRFDIRRLDLTDVGTGRPLQYTADVVNPRPTGDVHAFGHMGPWLGQNPRTTPIDGHYVFEHADLGSIKGLRGILSAQGDFSGQLSHLAVHGTTDTPQFALDVSAQPEPLSTTVDSTVDGTTGDTYLNHVHARLGSSEFETQGTVIRMHMPDNTEGHDIALGVWMPRGRMEDLLRLGMKTNPAVMRGAVALRAKLHIPPGKGRVAEKAQLDGTLQVQGVQLSNSKFQDRVDGLSMRAQGRPEEAGPASSDHKAEVASQMAVRFSLAHALVTVPKLEYDVPGAKVLLDGVYSLDGNLFEFKGHVRTQATASQMTTGWKSMLLRPVDGMLRKNGAGMELPVVISGAQGDFRFGLAMHNADESTAAMAADLKARKQVARH